MTTDQRAAANNLEIGTDKPNLSLMLQEIEKSMPRMQAFTDRNRLAMQYWQSRWDGQSDDGRRRVTHRDEEVFPFEGASDARVRTVKQVVRDHVTLAKAAFNRANVQAQSIRPLAPGIGRRANQETALLRWQINVLMQAEMQREVPLAANWRFGLGACAMAVEWEQARRLEYHELTLPLLADIIAYRDGLDENTSGQLYLQLQAAFRNPEYEQASIDLMSGLMLDSDGKPVLSTAQVRRAVKELSTIGSTEVPIPYLFKSKPKWTALRIGVDLMFIDQCGDLQEEPWTARLERVSETTLRDRAETEDYDPDFVEEVLKHRGNTSYDPTGMRWAAALDRAWLGDGSPNWSAEVEEKGIDLVHFNYKTIHYGTPCLYRTIFAPAIVQQQRGGMSSDKPLYALHGKHPYDHGQYPYVEMRMEKELRHITSSQGIPETAYTWEMEEKQQADGLADRTLMVNYRPMIVPQSKVHAIKGQMRPGAILGTSRPSDIRWMDMPPADPTPIEVMRQVALRVQEYFGIFGNDLDPQKKMLRQQEVGDDFLGEVRLALVMTHQLDKQYMSDDDVAAVVGPLKESWKEGRQSLQKMPQISVTFDAAMLDAEHLQAQIDLIGKLMPFNQGGTANTNAIFRYGAELVFGADAADLVIENDEAATERERRDEKQACIEIMMGSEPDKPMFANNQLRLQVIQEFMQQPAIYPRIMAQPEVLQLFQNRIEFYQNQIQQYQQNPAIGRALSTQTFDKKSAPRMQLAGASSS